LGGNRLPPPSIGSGLLQLDLKLEGLRRLRAEEGGPECLLIGSSMMYRAVNPEVMNRAFKMESGVALRSYNFGIRGLSPAGAERLTRVLLEDYRPVLLVFGCCPTDLGMDEDIGTTQRLQDNPWLHYRAGSWNLDGFLTEHSRAFQFWLGYLSLHPPEGENQASQLRRFRREMNRFGYGSSTRAKFRSNLNKDLPWVYKWRLAGFQADPAALRALERIGRLRKRVRVLFLEMPVHRKLIGCFKHGQADYDLGLEMMVRSTRRSGTPLWRSLDRNAIPDSGWLDRMHLNDEGAAIFSGWLGRQLAEFETGRFSSSGQTW